jgi:hypothetical protein
VQHGAKLSRTVMDEWFTAAGWTGAPEVKKLEAMLQEHKGKLEVNAYLAGDGSTALSIAADGGFAEVIVELLRLGADVERHNSDSGGITPLYRSAALCL